MMMINIMVVVASVAAIEEATGSRKDASRTTKLHTAVLLMVWYVCLQPVVRIVGRSENHESCSTSDEEEELHPFPSSSSQSTERFRARIAHGGAIHFSLISVRMSVYGGSMRQAQDRERESQGRYIPVLQYVLCQCHGHHRLFLFGCDFEISLSNDFVALTARLKSTYYR